MKLRGMSVNSYEFAPICMVYKKHFLSKKCPSTFVTVGGRPFYFDYLVDCSAGADSWAKGGNLDE